MSTASPETIFHAWRNSDLNKRLRFVLYALFIFVIGTHIAAPGIDKALVENLFAQTGGILDLLSVFTGGALERLSIFALGIMPYINASIMMQLATAVFPNLKERQQEGEEGRKYISKITRYLAIGLAFLQGTGLMIAIYGGPQNFNFGAITALFSVVGGTCFLMWLGDEISQKGVGNGMSILITIGIVAVVPGMIINELAAATMDQNRIFALIVFGALTVAVIAAIVYIQLSVRKIPIQYARRQVGRKVYGGQSTFLPMRIAQAGVIPIIFAISIVMVPQTILGFRPDLVDANRWWANFMNSGWYILLQFVLVFFFTYVYTAVTFNTQDIADNLKKNNGFIPGIRPGKPTYDFLDKVLNRITFFGATFLGLIAILPPLVQIIVSFTTNVQMTSFYLGGTSLLIVVGVALDTVQQMQAHLVMRHYSGLGR